MRGGGGAMRGGGGADHGTSTVRAGAAGGSGAGSGSRTGSGANTAGGGGGVAGGGRRRARRPPPRAGAAAAHPKEPGQPERLRTTAPARARGANGIVEPAGPASNSNSIIDSAAGRCGGGTTSAGRDSGGAAGTLVRPAVVARTGVPARTPRPPTRPGSEPATRPLARAEPGLPQPTPVRRRAAATGVVARSWVCSSSIGVSTSTRRIGAGDAAGATSAVAARAPPAAGAAARPPRRRRRGHGAPPSNASRRSRTCLSPGARISVFL